MVLDRLFLWMYTIASVIGSFVILLTAPALYDDSSDMAIKYSLVAQQLYGIPDFWIGYIAGALLPLSLSLSPSSVCVLLVPSYTLHPTFISQQNSARPAQTMSSIYLKRKIYKNQGKYDAIKVETNLSNRSSFVLKI